LQVLPVGAALQVVEPGIAAQSAGVQPFIPVPVNAPSEHVGSVPVFV
jgi:hypothetical protein